METLRVLKDKLEFGNLEQIQALKHLEHGEECEECCEGRILIDLDGYPISDEHFSVEVYDRPFSDESRIAYYCSEECLDKSQDSSWADFRYFDCPCCGRTVCEQNPSNGYHTQYRIYQDEKVCLRCFEKDILENGVARDEFDRDRLPGLFLSSDNSEAIDAGYVAVDGFINYKVTKPSAICDKALALIDEGCKVIVAYESMSIIGDEGYVTLFAKGGN